MGENQIKIVYSFNNFSNKSFNDYLKKKLKKKNSFLYTSNKIALKFFDKKKIIIAKNNESKTFEKFTTFKKNPVAKLYVFKSFLKGSLIQKLLITIKFTLDFINLLPEKNFFRNKIATVPKEIIDLDILYCDFRHSSIYTNNDVNSYARYKNKKIYCFIFSWDNYFATDVVKYADLYFVHSNYFKKILFNLHKIKKNKIRIYFPFLFHYFKNKVIKNNIKKKYLIYAFSHSSLEKDYFSEEVEVLKFISRYLYKIDKKILIIARFYPHDYNIKNNIFDKLKNVNVHKYGKIFKIKKNKNFIYDNNLKQKYLLIKNSICCINVFTTFGIESVLLGKPTIFVAIKNDKNILQYLHTIYFKLKFMPHFKIVKNKILFIDNYDDLQKNLLILLTKFDKFRFLRQNENLKKIFY
jgi:hypothetical protein